jgi:zinc transport system ATP-binding protein
MQYIDALGTASSHEVSSMSSDVVGGIRLEETILEVSKLSVVRSGNVIIKDIDLTVRKGEFVGIVGPNGSGKSTFLLAILGILKPHTGGILIYNSLPMSRKLHKRIGWVSQAASNLPRDIRITVRELVRLGTLNSSNMFDWSDNGRREKVDEAIKMTGLKDVENTDIGSLSGGQRQRAVIARALATEADFILLDEPLVGIDRDARNSLLRLLDKLCHEQGKTILMVSHDLAAIRQTAHRMIFLEEKIRFDGPTENFPDLEKLADLRGIEPVHGEGHDHQNNHLKEE